MQLVRFLIGGLEYCIERNPCLQPKWCALNLHDSSNRQIKTTTKYIYSIYNSMYTIVQPTLTSMHYWLSLLLSYYLLWFNCLYIQSNGATLNEYDYNDSFIDDSQLSNSNTPYHLNNVRYTSSSPVVHKARRRERRAYLQDSSDSDVAPPSTGGCVNGLMDDGCNDLSWGKSYYALLIDLSTVSLL